MNKKEFINELKNKLNYTEEKCNKINDIIEDTFIIGKKNKDKMLNKFISELNITKKDANKIYETVIDIISDGIKDKLKHPFKDLDK